MISAEGSSKLSVSGHKLRADNDPAHGETVGYALGYSDYVGAYSRILMGKETTRATISRLNFIENKHSSVTVTLLAKHAQEVIVGDADSAHTLNTLDYNGTDIALGKLATHCVDIIQRKECHMTVVVDRCHNLGIVGNLNRCRSAAVERLAECDDTRLSGCGTKRV